MKKFWKVTVFPGLFCVLAGLAIGAILVFGYSDELREHADEFSINEDNFFEYFDSDRFISVTRDGKRYDKSETRESYHFAVEEKENVTGAVFELAVGEVEIRTGDTMELVVTDMFEDAISSYVEDGIWYINDSLLGSGSVHSDYSPDIVITIPEDASFEQMNIYLAAGRMDADKLTAQELRLEVDAGSLKVFHLTAEDMLTVENGAGEIKLYDVTASNLTVNQGVGAIDITGAVTGNNVIKGGIGEIKLTLTNRERVDFNYKVTGGIGEVEIGDMVLHGDSTNMSYDRDLADYFEVDCGIGRVEIDVDEN